MTTFYLEAPSKTGGKFWRASVVGKEIHVVFGKLRCSGQPSKPKIYKDAAAAEAAIMKLFNAKIKKGYAVAVDPGGGGGGGGAAKAPKRKAAGGAGAGAAKKAKAKAKAKGKAKAKAAPAPSMRVQAVGTLQGGQAPVVDKACGLASNPDVRVVVDGADVYDVLLNLLDVGRHQDKYYKLQLLAGRPPPPGAPAGARAQSWVFTRWGKTGTQGQTKTYGPFAGQTDAEDIFCKIFKDKTKVTWSGRASIVGNPNPNPKGYNILAINYAIDSRDVTWQYHVGDGVDGKSNGWFDYTQAGSDEVEKIYQAALANPGLALQVRCVESGTWTYRIDLAARPMTQTNARHAAHKQRDIRRHKK